jgi:hypothetical protein
MQYAPERFGGYRSKSVNDTEGLLGLRFYTIGVSDGISMGT